MNAIELNRIQGSKKTMKQNVYEKSLCYQHFVKLGKKLLSLIYIVWCHDDRVSRIFVLSI